MASSLVRRGVHLILAFATLAAFTSRTQAGPRTVVDVEATPYGGTTSGELPTGGGCVFAPRVVTTFGGFGGRVRVRLPSEEGDPTTGFAVSAQGAVEGQSHRLLSPGSGGATAVPRPQAMLGGAVHVGYDLRYFGFYAGVGLREVIDAPSYPCSNPDGDMACLAGATYPSTRPSVYPDVGLRFGRSDGWHGVLLVGASNLATILRPGIHAGAGYTSRRGHELALRVGLQTTYPGGLLGNEVAPRLDVSGAWPLGRVVSIGAGVGFLTQEDRIDFDVRGALNFHFGR